jgi:dTDP-4-dehydrorhamnose reductase
MKIVVIGANGQLGSELCRLLEASGDEYVGLTHAEVEIADCDSVSSVLKSVKPQVVVNTSAMHNVESCEREPNRAFAVNGIGARNLALVCRDVGSSLIHVSTDYVFDGAKGAPYVESDSPRPLNVYGNSKLSGEYFVSSILERHFVLRTSALYGLSPCRAKGGLNFVELMLKLGKERETVRVVDNETVSPTSTVELAGLIRRLTCFDGYGLYHATAEESCTWYEFAREIFSLVPLKARLEVAGPNEFPAKVPRPSYSVLENSKLNRNNLNCFGSWQKGLRNYLSSRAACGRE